MFPNDTQIYLGFLFNIYTKINTKMKGKGHIQSFNEHQENLNISDVIKRLQTDESEITFGDYFMEVGCYKYIHQLVENYYEHDDYKLANGIDVVVMRKDDFEWNKEDNEYRRIVNVL